MIGNNLQCKQHNLPIQAITFASSSRNKLLCLKCALESPPISEETFTFPEEIKEIKLDKLKTLINKHTRNCDLTNSISNSKTPEEFCSQIKTEVQTVETMLRDISSEFMANKEENSWSETIIEEICEAVQLKEIRDLTKSTSIEELEAKVANLPLIHKNSNLSAKLDKISLKYSKETRIFKECVFFLNELSATRRYIEDRLSIFAHGEHKVKFVENSKVLFKNSKSVSSIMENSYVKLNFNSDVKTSSPVEWKMKFESREGTKIYLLCDTDLNSDGQTTQRQPLEGCFTFYREDDVTVGTEKYNVWVVLAVEGENLSHINDSPTRSLFGNRRDAERDIRDSNYGFIVTKAAQIKFSQIFLLIVAMPGHSMDLVEQPTTPDLVSLPVLLGFIALL